MINKYLYALELKSGNCINLTNSEDLIKSGRTFVIYQWEPAHEFEKIVGRLEKNESGVPVRTIKTIKLPNTGIWLPILRYTGKKWSSLKNPICQKAFISKMKPNNVMLKAHLFFKDNQEFSQWMGEDVYNKMIIDLL